jgi:hypothetical protein
MRAEEVKNALYPGVLPKYSSPVLLVTISAFHCIGAE